MENEELLNEFIDGTLDPGKEQELFYKLYADEALRTKLKFALALESTLDNKKNYFTPPAEATLGVFGALGIKAPEAAIKPPVEKSAGYKRFFAGRMNAFFAAVAAAALTAALFVISPFGDDSNSKKDFAERLTDKPATTLMSLPLDRADKGADLIEEVKSKSLSVNRFANTGNGEEKTSDPPVEEKRNDNADFRIATAQSSSIALDIGNIRTEKLNSNFLPADFPLTSDGGKNLGLSLELRGSSGVWGGDSPARPKRFSPLNNTALSLFYALDENFSAGLDLRQETFALKYTGFENDEEFVYYQQPNFTSVGLAARYGMNFDAATPFAQISLGGNKYGIALRLMTGAQYEIFDDISIALSGEYSRLFYSHDSNWFGDGKFAINYGLIYSF